MAYCTVADVERMLKEEYGQSSQPTKARVSDICDNVSAELDGYLAAGGYTVPVTDSQALAMLAAVAEKCAAVQVWHESRDTDASFPKIEDWRSDCVEFKRAVRKGEVWLPGVTPEGDAQPAFGVAPVPQRDRYWTTGQELDDE